MKVTGVKHIKDYSLEIKFSDKTVKQIDLRNFLMSATNPMTTKFRDVKFFKEVKIEYGVLSWGDSEMDLSAENLLEINSENNTLALI